MPADSLAFFPTHPITRDTFDIEGGVGSWKQTKHPIHSGFYALDSADIAGHASIAVAYARTVRVAR